MLYLVRHGQTPYNAENRLQGQLDIPLSDTGREQARELGERLKAEGPRVKKLYCSTLSRAGETARIIGRALSLTPITVKGLEEIYFGRFQGHMFTDCARLFPEAYADYLIHGSNSNAHGGETGFDVMERARKALLKLPESANSEPALVVCHGAVIGFLRAAAEGLPLNDVRAFIPKNAELCEFTPEMMERIAAYGKEQ
jgi:broad specificity phosphatase PhoE